MFRQNYRSRALIAVLLTAVVVLRFESSVVAQDESPDKPVVEQPAERADGPADVQTDPSNAADSESDEISGAAQRVIDEQETERLRESARKSAMAGLLVLSLICIVFLVLIVLVALWARRIRLLTRQPLPEQHPGDPLWYLRKGKGSDSSDVAGLTDGGSSHGDS